MISAPPPVAAVYDRRTHAATIANRRTISILRAIRRSQTAATTQG